MGANTEAGTGARRRADRGGIDIEDGERGQGNEGNHADLGQLEALAGQEVGGNGHSEALKGVLDRAGRQVGKINSSIRGRRLVLGHFYRKEQRKNHLTNIQRWRKFY